jgi:YHS domain-containing protein
MKKFLLIGLLVAVAGIAGFAMLNKVAPVSWGLWGPVNQSAGVAIGGYDPVAYHKVGEAQLGREAFTAEWNGTRWNFASEENLRAFQQSPEKYAPRFGGYCAFAVSKGVTADADPTAWHIHESQLYLFADQGVKREWVAALSAGSLIDAENNWRKRR